MAAAAPAGSGGRASTPFQHDWEALVRGDALKREDIYRQRVFGNNSGAKDFIQFEDRREFKWPMLVLYIVFAIIAYHYADPRMKINVYYKVNDAVQTAIHNTPFVADPVPRYFNDIKSMQDVQDFLLNAFPSIVAPEVQNFNRPLGAVRFTLRKMQSEPNKEDRFNAFTQTIWENTDGIRPDETSSDNDDKNNFGLYRVWANASLDWSANPVFENKKCPRDAELIDTVAFPGVPADIREANCKRWCAQLRFPKTCHCISTSKMSDGTCNFYQVPLTSFVSENQGAGLMGSASRRTQNAMSPKLLQASGSDVYYPLMKQFAFESDNKGYKETPGFVQSLKFYTQDQLDQASADPAIGLTTPPRIIHSAIDDWIQGGFLGTGAATLIVDFATFNPNYDVFTWVNLIFRLHSSGFVQTQLDLGSMQVRNEQDITAEWTAAKEMWGSFVDLAYLILVIFYICWELWEMSCCNRGLKYFGSTWNWVTLLSVLLHLATIALWWQYRMKQDFVTTLQNLRDTGGDFAPDGEDHAALNALGIQLSNHYVFKMVCAFNLFFVLMQLLRYLSDIQPRVAVLMDTVSNSVVPIGFMAVVILTALLGICICTNVVFGREVPDFNSLLNSVRTIFLLTIGEFDALKNLRDIFGDSSFYFYLPYMTFNIIIIVNFPRAVLNAAYEDAHASHTLNIKNETSRQRAMETNNTGDWGRTKKMVINFVKGLFPEDFKVEDMQRQVARHSQGGKYKRSAMAGYLFFNLVFVVMTIMITRTNKSNRMMVLVEQAVKSPSFAMTNDITGEVIEGGNFDSITTRKHVGSWFSQVLPHLMFASSKGTLDGNLNYLKEYDSAYPTIFQQLVINNWNIMVGQKPVRITSQVSKMSPLGEGRAIVGVTTPSDFIRDSGNSGKPDPTEVSRIDGLLPSKFKGATVLSDITSDKQRTSLERYCEYSFGYGVSEISKDGKNPDKEGYAFVCMLDVDEATTRDELTYMNTHEMITDQTMTLSFEFVIYNAYAKTFGYVSVWFAFDPSGMIYKDIRVESMTLELYEGFWGIFQLIVEFLVLFLNVLYFLQLLGTLYKTVRDSNAEKKSRDPSGKGPQGARRVFGWIQTIVCFFIFDLLNPLELLSCIVTFVTMSSWYQFVTSTLTSNYFFMEQPVWVNGFCVSNNFEWCSDTEVLTKFFSAQAAFRLFIQMCACNTILVFLRILKFLRPYPHMRVIFKTFGRAFGDLVWFVAVYCIILSGYTMLGHYIFGTQMGDYSTFDTSLRSCFEMFLGTIDFKEMSRANFFTVLFFTASYWFVLKLLAFNMFLAIIDKNYQSEKREQAKLLRDQQEQQDKEPKKPSFFSTLKAQVMAVVKGSKKGSGDASAQKGDSPTTAAGTPASAGDPAKGEKDAAEEASEDDEPAADNILELVGGTAAALGGIDNDPDDDDEDDIVGEEVIEDDGFDAGTMISKDRVVDERWDKLPKEIKDWAIDKAQGLCRFLADDDALSKIFKNQSSEAQDDLAATGHEVLLENAESNIKKKKKELSTEQKRARRELDDAELSELKKVHQDQESLSWYIMKREAELKKLESQKDLKRDRYEKLVNATKSLISSQDQTLLVPPETRPGERSTEQDA